MPARDRLGVVLLALPLLTSLAVTVLTLAAADSLSVTVRQALTRRVPFHDAVAMVAVGPSTMATAPAGAEVPPAHLADVLSRLVEVRPRVVVLDALVGPRERGAPGMAALAAAVRGAVRQGVAVVMPAVLADGAEAATAVYAPDVSLDGVLAGYRTLSTDATLGSALGLSGPPRYARVRHVRPARAGRDAVSLALAAVAAYREGAPGVGCSPGAGPFADPGTRPRPEVAALTAALPNGAAGLLHYAAPHRSTDGPHFLRSEAFLRSDAADPERLRGKLVVVTDLTPRPDGSDSVALPDGTARRGALLVHAIDTLLSGRAPRRVPGPWGELAVVLGVAAASYGFGSRPAARRTWGALGVATLALAAAAAAGTVGVFLAAHVWGLVLPLVWPLAAAVVGASAGFVLGRGWCRRAGRDIAAGARRAGGALAGAVRAAGRWPGRRGVR